MNLKKILFILLTLLFVSYGNVTLADSCQCTDRNTAVLGACEQKSENECYGQLNTKKSCSFFTDDACKKIKNIVANGLAWTADECRAAKGDWRPEGDAVIGPYCFEKQDFAQPFNLSVDILNINRTGGISNLAQYINLVYKFIIGLAIFFAIIMTTAAGLKWLTAGGNAGKIGEAKKMIVNAVIGIIIAAGAYTILATINPRILELHLPLIPKIKTINYVGVRGCEGYLTQADCEQNRLGLNTGIAPYAPAGYSGTSCAWDSQSRQCLQGNKSSPGEKGGLCLAGDTCSGALKCVFTANIRVCTDGNANSVCGIGPENNGCNAGLVCDTSVTSICYDPNSSRPAGISCNEGKQCASGICEGGRCTIGQCDPAKCPTGQTCLLTKTSQFKSCQKPPECFTHEVCQQTYGSTYFCPQKLYEQTNNNNLAIQYLTSYYGKSNYPNTKICQEGKQKGASCRFNIECANGSCNGLDDTKQQLGTCN